MTPAERKKRIEFVREENKSLDNGNEFGSVATIKFLLSELDRLDEALRKIVKGPQLMLQRLEPHTPFRIAELTARYSQQVAREALGETE